MELRKLQIIRAFSKKCRFMVFGLYLDENKIGDIVNDDVCYSFISSVSHTLRVEYTDWNGKLKSSNIVLPSGSESIAISIGMDGKWFERRITFAFQEYLEVEYLPLENIQSIDEVGMLYTNSRGESTNISFYEAHRRWCLNKHITSTRSKTVCDREKLDSEHWKLTFYTFPIVVFQTDATHEDLWVETINSMHRLGWATFDNN